MSRPTPRQKALALIEQAGAEWDEYESDGLEGAAYTPVGIIWRATDCHTLSVSFYTDRPAGWRSLLEDLERGTIPCDNPACDICGDPEGE